MLDPGLRMDPHGIGEVGACLLPQAPGLWLVPGGNTHDMKTLDKVVDGVKRIRGHTGRPAGGHANCRQCRAGDTDSDSVGPAATTYFEARIHDVGTALVAMTGQPRHLAHSGS